MKIWPLSLFRQQAPARPRRIPQLRMPRREYAGGVNSRLTADWWAGHTSADVEIQRFLPQVRNRARDLERNNDYVRHFLGMVVKHVVGPKGIRLQSRVRDPNGDLDRDANDRIEEAWAKWGRKGTCTMDGQVSWKGVQRLAARATARDGEIIIQVVRGRKAGNPFNFALHVMEADHLDVELNRDLGNGRQIRMGVELNEWGRPMAYHLLTSHPGDDRYLYRGRRYMRVEAQDIIMPFVRERAQQTRGMSWLASAIMRLKMLGAYEEAELIAARIGASKMGFFTSEDGDSYEGDDEDEGGNLISEVEPGVFEQLPAGTSLQTFDPQHPNSQFGIFIKALLRGIAAGMEVSYNTLANDLEGVNYSSIRHGTLEERDQWRVLQEWAIEDVCTPVFSAWLEMALLGEALRLPFAKFDKFNAPAWQPRGWQWVDPAKEVRANQEAVAAGFKSRDDVAAETGKDVEETFASLAEEEKLAQEYGLTFGKGTKPDEQEQPPTPAADAAEE